MAHYFSRPSVEDVSWITSLESHSSLYILLKAVATPHLLGWSSRVGIYIDFPNLHHRQSVSHRTGSNGITTTTTGPRKSSYPGSPIEIAHRPPAPPKSRSANDKGQARDAMVIMICWASAPGQPETGERRAVPQRNDGYPGWQDLFDGTHGIAWLKKLQTRAAQNAPFRSFFPFGAEEAERGWTGSLTISNNPPGHVPGHNNDRRLGSLRAGVSGCLSAPANDIEIANKADQGEGRGASHNICESHKKTRPGQPFGEYPEA
ncbi:hypothetical protein B7463_g7930, partial [Scytalidium lignicola]